MSKVAEKGPVEQVGKNGSHKYVVLPLTREELIEALYNEPGKAEIVHGKVKRFMPTGDVPGSAALNVNFALKRWIQATGASGRTYGDSVGFLVDLPHRVSVSPDASYHIGERSGAKFLASAPIFAVEVRSENDYGPTAEREMQNKRMDYFSTDTEVVWDVDVLKGDEIIRKYTKAGGAETPVAVYKRGEVADADPAVPGFTMNVDELFE